MKSHKPDCLICQIIDGKIPSHTIYDDETCLAFLDINGASPGHCFVAPKLHCPILEQVPDEEVEHMFGVANDISVALFETLGVSGTNLFVPNGIAGGQTIAHAMIQVIPRKENDGISLEWTPKQLSEEEMSTVELKLKDEIKDKGFGVKHASTETHDLSQTSAAPVADQEWYRKQLRRLP